jgi:hypothetical protein
MSEQAQTRNATQREEWNSAAGSRWLERHVAVDKQIAPFGHRAMERAGIQPGQHVLDIGCDDALCYNVGGVTVSVTLVGQRAILIEIPQNLRGTREQGGVASRGLCLNSVA